MLTRSWSHWISQEKNYKSALPGMAADRVMRHGGIGSTKELLDWIDASTQIPQVGIL